MIKVIEDYITKEEELLLLSSFPKRATSPSAERNSIVRYGSILPYKANVDPHIPSHFEFLLKRLSDDKIIESDSITVNEYQPSQAIDWHVDSIPSGPTIIVLSLKSSATMGLRKKNDENNKKDISLPNRSLLILNEEERYQWEHCIYPVSEHRYSVVFRRGTNVDI